MPDKIKDTEWGKIFVAYFPIHEKGHVVGVLGIEFDASHQFQAFQSVQRLMLVIGIFALVAVAFIAIRMFKRISNPLFNDMKNTDYLTGLKSRNAFDMDVSNIQNFAETGFIIADMNGLKQINDEQGHSMGDHYIEAAAQILGKALSNMPVYRYGGDEFIAITSGYSEDDLKHVCEHIYECVADYNKTPQHPISLSIGYACFDESLDENLIQTFKRADNRMYECKKTMKNAKEN